MICSNCGKEMPENAKFCAKCGHRMASHQIIVDKVEISTNEKHTNAVDKGIIALFAVVISVILITGITACILAPKIRIKAKLSLGDKYLSESRYEDAIAAYETVLKIDPKSEEAYIGLAMAYAEKGDLVRAAEVADLGISMIETSAYLSNTKNKFINEIVNENRDEYLTPSKTIIEKNIIEEPKEEIENGDDSEEVPSLEEALPDLKQMKYVLLSVAYDTAYCKEYVAGRNDYWYPMMILADYTTYNDDTGIASARMTEDYRISISEEDVKQCIAAIDCTFDGMPKAFPVKNKTDDFYRYTSGMYSFEDGEMGSSWPELIGIKDNGDGTFTEYALLAGLDFDDEREILEYYKIKLVPNKYTDNPQFKYSVESSEIIERNEYDSIADKLIRFE